MRDLNPVKWMKASVALVAAAVAALALAACTPEPRQAKAPVSDRLYTVTPDALTVKSGIVSGQVTEMKVTERVAEGGAVETPAKLTGKLVLKNVSADQSVRFLTGRIVYMDLRGKPIVLEDNRTEPTLKLSSGYGANDRLDPGQDTAQAIDVEFPVEALKAKRLKDIRLELTYIPSSFREETLSFPVSIGR